MYKTLVLGLVVACSSKDAAPSTSAGSNTAPKQSAALPGKLDCTNILSPALRAKYFANIELRDHPESIGSVGECQIVAKGSPMGTLNVACHGKVGRDIAPSVAMMKKTMASIEELPGVGRAALISRDPDLTFVMTWDDDSNCEVTMRIPKSIDAVAFAKDLTAYLPPK